MASCLYSGGATASAGNGARIEAPSRTDTNFLKRVIGILLFLVGGFLGATADKKGPFRFLRNGPRLGAYNSNLKPMRYVRPR